jgi:hypothetical protein
MMTRTWCAVVLAAAWLCGCKGKMETVISDKNPPPAAEPVRNPADLEADDAIETLRWVWPVGLELDAAEGADNCDRQARGFSRVRECYAHLLEKTRVNSQRLPKMPVGKLACGKEIEAAHRRLADHEVEWLTAQVAWIDKVRPRLERALAGRTLSDACDLPGDPCDGRPLPGEGYGVVMKVACTKTIFVCGAADNVCWINKVAAALDLGPDAKSGGLTVRATGRVIAR